MQAANALAGYSLGGADLLRRAMGKKKPEEMEKQRVTFVKGCADTHKIPKAKAEKILTRWRSLPAMVLTKPTAPPTLSSPTRRLI